MMTTDVPPDMLADMWQGDGRMKNKDGKLGWKIAKIFHVTRKLILYTKHILYAGHFACKISIDTS